MAFANVNAQVRWCDPHLDATGAGDRGGYGAQRAPRRSRSRSGHPGAGFRKATAGLLRPRTHTAAKVIGLGPMTAIPVEVWEGGHDSVGGREIIRLDIRPDIGRCRVEAIGLTVISDARRTCASSGGADARLG
jgi:hypothetical protein